MRDKHEDLDLRVRYAASMVEDKLSSAELAVLTEQWPALLQLVRAMLNEED